MVLRSLKLIATSQQFYLIRSVALSWQWWHFYFVFWQILLTVACWYPLWGCLQSPWNLSWLFAFSTITIQPRLLLIVACSKCWSHTIPLFQWPFSRWTRVDPRFSLFSCSGVVILKSKLWSFVSIITRYGKVVINFFLCYDDVGWVIRKESCELLPVRWLVRSRLCMCMCVCACRRWNGGTTHRWVFWTQLKTLSSPVASLLERCCVPGTCTKDTDSRPATTFFSPPTWYSSTAHSTSLDFTTGAKSSMWLVALMSLSVEVVKCPSWIHCDDVTSVRSVLIITSGQSNLT